MRRSIRSWIPVAVLVAAVGSGPAAVASVSSAGTAAASQPAVKDCGAGPALVRPASLVLTCADDGELAEHLAWSSWTATRATAAGIVTWNRCVPDCAESRHWSSTSADITLSDPVAGHEHRLLFTQLVLHVTGPTPRGFLRNPAFYEGSAPAPPPPARPPSPVASPATPAAPSGTLGYAQIEGYWAYAGGPSGSDPSVPGYTYEQVAAAITGAESSFYPGNIQPGVDYCDPAPDRAGWGLWQITCGNAVPQYGTNFQVLDPWNNAEAAVNLCDYDAAHGHNCFYPWVTYNNGTYAQHLAHTNPDFTVTDPGEYVQYHSTPPGTPASPPPDPGSTYGPPMPNTYQIAFQANNHHLWYYTSANAGHRDSGLGMEADTSPSVAATGEVAFQATNNDLWLYDPSTGGNRDTGLGMSALTNPAIVSLAGGGYEIAFQDNQGILYLNDPSTGTSVNTGLGMDTSTSPAIAATSGGSYAVAFRANTGDLWYYTPTNAGHRDTGLGMSAGTSPSVAATGEVAFQGTNNDLWLYDPSTGGNRDTGLGMSALTNPAIVSLAGGGYEIAFQDNQGILYLYNPSTGTNINTGLGMDTSTSPAITATPSGSYAVAFQANNNHLWYYTPTNAGHRDTGLGMDTLSNPAISVP